MQLFREHFLQQRFGCVGINDNQTQRLRTSVTRHGRERCSAKIVHDDAGELNRTPRQFCKAVFKLLGYSDTGNKAADIGIYAGSLKRT